jgi:TBC1 domain family member 2A
VATRRDILFNEEDNVLFYVALTIFKVTHQLILVKDYFHLLSHYLCPPRLQMREDDLLRTQHIGDVIDILQTTTHHLYDPDELLMVIFFNAIS